jgi:hypothetical protein
VLSQKNVDVRVLIIDDASLDNTSTVAKQLAATDCRVSYIRNEINLGLIRTANKGVLDWARAPYTLLLSCHTPCQLQDADPESALRCLIEHKKCAVA